MFRIHMTSVDDARAHRYSILQRLETVVHVWLRRHRTRRVLAALNDYELRDIGLSRDDARRETGRPFWSPGLRT
jgi:uncharacterized protein YjiS (DUF1127 family)